MGAGRITLLVFGVLFVLISFGFMVGGGAILAVNKTFKDAEGFYSTGSMPVEANSSAIITHPADIHVEPVWLISNRNPLTVRVAASCIDSPDKQVFIGIAHEMDLDKYLKEVNRYEVIGFSFRPYRIDFRHVPGNVIPDLPDRQDFWVASASGPGIQTVEWDVSSGSYSIVIMNADGSSPVNVDIVLGARVPEIFDGAGPGMLFGGIGIFVIGGLMIYYAARRKIRNG